MEAIVAAHEARLADLDPLLPRRQALPDLNPGETPMVVDGGAALARRIATEPEAMAAAWGALDTHRLVARVGGHDPAVAMERLLGWWSNQVHAVGAAADSSAQVIWPSRDVAMNRLYLARGLVPYAVLAARRAGAPTPGPSSAASVRPLRDGDLDAAVELALAEVSWAEQCGPGVVRETTADAFRRAYTAALEQTEPWTWVAELDGRVVGLITVDPPDRTWVGPLTSAASPAYIGTTSVAAAERGTGVGAALVRRVHAALDDAGADITLLHHNVSNPLSAPFWSRCGYRPLWTTWEVRPATHLR